MHLLLKILLALILFSPSTISQSNDTLWIDDFQSETLKDWQGNRSGMEKVYNISSDTAGQFLHAISKNDDLFIIKEAQVDLVEYPFLNWSWRVHELPTGGNEKFKKTCDIAASVYVVLKASRWRPRSIKFSWSTTLPEDSYGKSPFAIWPSRSDYKVLHSGSGDQGIWVHEKINVLEEYKKLYNKKDVDQLIIEAMSIMSDSDNTSSRSVADYDNIYFSRN